MKKVGGKRQTVIPIDAFLGERKRGRSVVTKALEEKMVISALETSYRKSRKILEGKRSTENIRQKVIAKGEEAKVLEKSGVNPLPIEEKESKEAQSPESTYKKAGKQTQDTKDTKQAKGSFIRKFMAKLFELRIIYFMADGVGVERQYPEDEKKKGKRECKVGLFLSQTGETIKELGTFCTWNRVDEFKKMTENLLLKILIPFTTVVIISDGAKWIRNLRKKIPRLEKAIWILDWFHLKDTTLKMFRVFGLTEESEGSEESEESQAVKTTLSWLWHGNTQKALEIINKLPFAQEEQEREKQEIALRKLKTYLKNQEEGIVNYQAYKMKGYLVGSGYMEKRNDTLIKDRMVRQGRMKWGLKGGEAMMQLLTARMNGRLGELFA